MKKYFLALTLLILTKFAMAGGNPIYDSIIKPNLLNCQDTTLKDRTLVVKTDSFQAWDIGRFVYRSICYSSDFKSKNDPDVLFEKSKKEGDDDKSPVIPAQKCEKCREFGLTGSIIKMDTRVLQEHLPIIGTPFSIIYSSDNVPDRLMERTINIPLYEPNTDVTGFELKISYAGRVYTNTYSNVVDQAYVFAWDGKNASNVDIPSATVEIEIGYIITGEPDPIKVTYETKLVNSKPLQNNIGGWYPTIVHRFDFTKNMVFFATGGVSKSTPYYEDPYFRVFSDDGSEAYYFDVNGRHIKTVNGLMGTVKYTFEYDSTWGTLNKIKNSLNEETLFNVNSSNGRITSITGPGGLTTALTYNSNGYLQTIVNPASETYSMTYSTGGLLLTFTKPEGEVSTMTYDALGGLLKDEHSGGFSTTLEQYNDNSGYPAKFIKSTTELGFELLRQTNNNYESSSQGNTSTTSPLYGNEYTRYEQGAQSTKFVSHTESLSLEADPRLPTSRYTAKSTMQIGARSVSTDTKRVLNSAGSSAPFLPNLMTYTTKTPNGDVVTTFDGLKKTWKTILASGRTQSTTIDQLERPVRIENGNLAPTLMKYTIFNNVASITQGDRSTRFSYDKNGFQTQVVNPLGLITKYSRDNAGRIKSKIAPGYRETKYEYDDNGRMISLTTPNGDVHEFAYNSKELLSEYRPPAIGSSNVKTVYAYDDDKRVTSITLPDSRVISYDYYTDGRLGGYGKTSEGKIVFLYDRAGTQYPETVWRIGQGKIEKEYFGPYLSAETFIKDATTPTTVGKVAFGFDDQFRHSRVVVINGAGEISYHVPYYLYDKDNLITKAGDLSIKRDVANGFPLSNKIGSSENVFEYDSKYGELSKIEHRYKGVSDLLQTFKRDALGRISEINSAEGAIVLHYDESGRFLGRKYKGSEKIISQFNYDKNGNRVSGSDRGISFEAEFDDHDRLTQFNDTTYTYNLNGTLATSTTDSVTTTYSFDVFGNLVYISKTGMAVGYTYDGHNRRFEKFLNSSLVARYLWQSQYRLAAVMNPDNTIKQQFIYADGVNAPEYMLYQGKRYHFIKDSRSSILKVVDADSDEIVQQLTYSEFGEILEDTNPGFQPFGFAGGLYDPDTKLVKFGARDYDGKIGRWLSKDPIRFEGRDENLYGYVMNDPVNNFDFSGLLTETERTCLDDAADYTNELSQEGIDEETCSEYSRRAVASCGLEVTNPNYEDYTPKEEDELEDYDKDQQEYKKLLGIR